MGKFLTQEEFLVKANALGRSNIDLSKVVYKDSKSHVIMICHAKDEFGQEHGEFLIRPNHYLTGRTCPKCSKTYRYSTEEYIEKCKLVHNGKYSYDKSVYSGSKNKLIITCPIHGDFEQRADIHLNGGSCPICANNRLTTEEFINRAKEKHGDLYDYSKVEYKNSYTDVTIICKEHGEFNQTPINHLDGKGCPICGLNSSASNRRKTLEQFIDEAKSIFGDKYDYSKVEYVNSHTPITIIDKKYGEFKILPYIHLQGCGHPLEKKSSIEILLKETFIKNNINFIEQKTFDWLRYKGLMFLDFYLVDYNIAIECQGMQHFKSVKHFGGDETFEYRRNRDLTKKKLCLENNVKLIYFFNAKFNNLNDNGLFEPYFNDIDNLMNYIENAEKIQSK